MDDRKRRTLAKIWIAGGPIFIGFAVFQLMTLDQPVAISVSWPFGPWLIDTFGVRGLRIATAAFFAALGALFMVGGWCVLKGTSWPPL